MFPGRRISSLGRFLFPTPVLLAGTQAGNSGGVQSAEFELGISNAIGDFIVFFLQSAGAANHTQTAGTTGWTKFHQTGPGSFWYKVATQANEIITIKNDNNNLYVWTYGILKFSGANKANITALANFADPPLHSAGELRNHTWLAVLSNDGATSSSSGAPANYTTVTNQAGSGTDHRNHLIAKRDLQASAENPGVFAGSAGFPHAHTVAIWKE